MPHGGADGLIYRLAKIDKNLKLRDAPKADFALLDGEKDVAVYAYCNLHGLWKA